MTKEKAEEIKEKNEDDEDKEKLIEPKDIDTNHSVVIPQ